MGTETEADKIPLASFARVNRETKNEEEIRVEAGHYNGYIYTHFRVWYSTPSGFRPSKQGVALREQEIDQAIEALQRVKAMIEEAGRSTAADGGSRTGRGKGFPAPHPKQSLRSGAKFERRMPWDEETTPENPTRGPRPKPRASASGRHTSRSTPPWEPKSDTFDEFDEG